MMKRPLALLQAFLITATCLMPANWPKAGGPDGTWRFAVNDAPESWSVTLNQKDEKLAVQARKGYYATPRPVK